MKIDVKADISEATKSLSKLGKKEVKGATLSALRDATKKANTLAVRYASKDFKMKQKDIKRKKIVYQKKPNKFDMWGAVWFNEYKDSLNTKKGYTIADANHEKVKPRPGRSVIGQAFKIKTKGMSRGNQLIVKRDSRKLRTKDKVSSEVQALYYTRSVRNAEIVASNITAQSQVYFYKRFEYWIDRRLKKAGLK